MNNLGLIVLVTLIILAIWYIVGNIRSNIKWNKKQIRIAGMSNLFASYNDFIEKGFNHILLEDCFILVKDGDAYVHIKNEDTDEEKWCKIDSFNE